MLSVHHNSQGGLTSTNTITGSYFYGNGSNLTGVGDVSGFSCCSKDSGHGGFALINLGAFVTNPFTLAGSSLTVKGQIWLQIPHLDVRYFLLITLLQGMYQHGYMTGQSFKTTVQQEIAHKVNCGGILRLQHNHAGSSTAAATQPDRAINDLP